MNRDWTPKQNRNRRFYRVCHGRQVTKFQPAHGFEAQDSRTWLFSPNQNLPFVQLIQRHRRQDFNFESPFISVFENRAEAEMWAIGADDVSCEGVSLVIINGNDENLNHCLMWRVNDIARQFGLTFHNGAESEWLVLYHIPSTAIIQSIPVGRIRLDYGGPAERDPLFPHDRRQTPGAVLQEPREGEQDDNSRVWVDQVEGETYQIVMPAQDCGCAGDAICEHFVWLQ